MSETNLEPALAVGPGAATRAQAAASRSSSRTRVCGLIVRQAWRLARDAIVAATLVLPPPLGAALPVAQAAELAVVPIVTGVAPTSGPPMGGSTVTVSGSGFTGATAVSFGSTPGVALVTVNDTQLKVFSPADTGVVDVTVMGPGGTSATTAVDRFAYGAPVVTEISPASGPPTGGTLVTVSGSNFTGATAVSFGSTPNLDVVLVSDSQLAVVAPAGTGKVDLTVTGVGGTSAKSSKDKFSYAPDVSGSRR